MVSRYVGFTLSTASFLPVAAGLAPEEAETRQENWGGVLQEVALPGCHGTADFMRQAVDFANNKCWGTLAAR